MLSILTQADGARLMYAAKRWADVADKQTGWTPKRRREYAAAEREFSELVATMVEPE